MSGAQLRMGKTVYWLGSGQGPGFDGRWINDEIRECAWNSLSIVAWFHCTCFETQKVIETTGFPLQTANPPTHQMSES